MLGMPQSAVLVQAAYILQSGLGAQMEPRREMFQELCGLCWSYQQSLSLQPLVASGRCTLIQQKFYHLLRPGRTGEDKSL